MNIITGMTPTAPKLMLYSLPGVGKSTLAATLRKPIFLDFEGGLNYIDCARTEQITDLDTFYTYLVELYREKERQWFKKTCKCSDFVTFDILVLNDKKCKQRRKID